MKGFILFLAFGAFCLGSECVEITGKASWYGGRFHGRKTASGDIFDKHSLTAASKTHRFGSYLLVREPKSGKAIIVRVNDRGPFKKGRIIDLSYGAAKELGIVSKGVATVQILPLECLVAESELP
ncbi:MAG: septal ring lytic transglycosylase RlpA family protein [Aquificaceae bacterium]|nr:septal ring lytic transglycosylase RlpA family protein [Aquificaceae bacterium]MDW8237586.1 septal ring lytic transglycosylase RlpA family protein [Aquificaceae bacterium]